MLMKRPTLVQADEKEKDNDLPQMSWTTSTIITVIIISSIIVIHHHQVMHGSPTIWRRTNAPR